ncbi:hypothetical protein NDU88_001406 [Pleurodeles waltl]|uniref:Uncharacterized protein n=1 Tax=Pleurodeles waltl TaxID=8319 RepID=A0AAV7TK16_PLEWA|nr:hypothetical protein NDU88_001406 [Pleurodeles waltl]
MCDRLRRRGLGPRWGLVWSMSGTVFQPWPQNSAAIETEAPGRNKKKKKGDGGSPAEHNLSQEGPNGDGDGYRASVRRNHRGRLKLGRPTLRKVWGGGPAGELCLGHPQSHCLPGVPAWDTGPWARREGAR